MGHDGRQNDSAKTTNWTDVLQNEGVLEGHFIDNFVVHPGDDPLEASEKRTTQKGQREKKLNNG